MDVPEEARRGVEKAIRDMFGSFEETESLRTLVARLPELTNAALDGLGPMVPAAPSNSRVVCLGRPMMAALCYDRVWSPWPRPGSAEPILFRGWTEPEAYFAAKFFLARVIAEGPPDLAAELFFRWSNSIFHGLRDRLGLQVADIDSIKAGVTKSIAQATGAVPIYPSSAARDAEFVPGDRSVALATATNVALVDEDHLTWEQVAEFRKDKPRRKAYRRFVHWLDKDMVGRDASFIQDEIAIRLERYEDAIKTHGLKTVKGALQGLLDPKFLLGSAGTSSMVALQSQPLWGLLAGGFLALGKVCLTIIEHLLSREDVKQQHAEIAWVYDLKKELGSKESPGEPGKDGKKGD